MLEWIISSAVLTAIVIVLRLILKGKMSLRLQYALWAIVLLRLLIPVSFGSTGMSVQNVVARPAVEAPQASDTFAYSAQNDTLIKPVIDEKTKPQLVYPGTTDPQALDKINKFMEEVASRFSTEVSAEAQHLTVNEILNIVWACGAGLIALWLLITNLHFYRKLRRSRKPLEVEHAPLRVFVTDKIDTPCLFGLIRPKIYVTPEVAADETALRYSIEHEATHRRHGDHVWSLLRGLCLAVHWYNPLVWVAAILSRRDAELACDEATIRRIGEEHRADYGRTLIQLTCQKRSAIFVAATTMTGSGRGIKERIKLIVKKPKTAIITLIAIVLVIAIAVGCTFTGAKTDEETTDPTESGETTPSAGELDVSGIPALLDAIDLHEASIVYHGAEDVDYPADTAIRAELYLELLKRFPWDICEAIPADPTERAGDCVRIVCPKTTVTFYEKEQDNGGCLHVETDGAAVWLRYPTDLEEIYEIRQDESHRFVGTYSVYYGEMLRWFVDARGAALHGGDGRLLTAEELDFFEDYTAAWPVTWHGTIRNEFEGEYAPEIKWWNNTEVSCFFTASYSDVRDINAEEFLRAFPYDGTYETFSVEQEESPMPLMLRRIPRSSVNEVLMKYAGVTVEEMNMNWFETVTYDADADCFYPEYNYAVTPMHFQAQTGVENGSVVTLWDWGDVSLHPYAELRLEKHGDDWRILSFTREGEIGTTPARDRLDASDIPALLDAIDLNEATLTYHSEADADHPVGTHRAYPAAASLEAAYYMEHMTEFPWESIPTENNAPSEVRGDYVRLAAPHVTVTYYQREQDNGCCYSVQTDQAEVWFHYPSEMYKNPPGFPEFRVEDRFDYYEMCLWYAQAELTTLYGGSGRLLTQEELSGIRCEFMTTTKVENGIPMIKFQNMAYFFTSTYSDVRNLNAREFLRWFPNDDFAAEDETVVLESGEHVLIRHIPRSAVNEVLMKYAGITAEEMNTNWFEEAGYDPETDCFLVEAGYAGMPYQTFFPVVGVENGDVITLWGKADYDNGLENPAYRLTLEKNGDGWRILSYVLEN